MSATGRGAERRASDYYPTPAWCIWRLLDALSLPCRCTWLEPAAGDGAIVRAVNAVVPDLDWVAVDIRPECEEPLRAAGAELTIGSFLDLPMSWQATRGVFDVAILNPPFTLAQQFIERCKGMARWVVALERLNFLEGDERCEWLRADPPDVYVLPNRPSFTGEGTDATAYAWLVWPPERGRAHGKVQILATTHTDDRRARLVVTPQGDVVPAQGRLAIG